jgi:alkylated DNA repair dioxygenase AlkB
MTTLFPDLFVPEGFHYHHDFLTIEEEEQLLRDIGAIELHPLIFQGFEAKRKVSSFGYDWSFDKRTLSRGKEIPPAFDFLIQKIADQIEIAKNAFAELLITEYPVGSVINWHRDAPPFDVIIGISLLSDCIFRLRPYDKKKQTRNAIISFPVKQRSLYILKEAARTDWEHSIPAVKHLRYSITLRTLRQ